MRLKLFNQEHDLQPEYDAPLIESWSGTVHDYDINLSRARNSPDDEWSYTVAMSPAGDNVCSDCGSCMLVGNGATLEQATDAAESKLRVIVASLESIMGSPLKCNLLAPEQCHFNPGHIGTCEVDQ